MFGRLVEAGAVIPAGHLEIIVISLVHVEINTASRLSNVCICGNH